MFRKGWICVIINFPFSPFIFAWPSCKNFNGKKLDIFQVSLVTCRLLFRRTFRRKLSRALSEKGEKEIKARRRRVIRGDMGGH